jgi:hypothetical protein
MNGSLSNISVAVVCALVGATVLLAFLRSHLDSRLRGRIETALSVVVLLGIGWGIGYSVLERAWPNLALFLFLALCIGWSIVRARGRLEKLKRQTDTQRSST